MKKVTKVDYSKANGVIDAFEKATDKVKHFDAVEAGIDAFADDMIKLINQQREKLK